LNNNCALYKQKKKELAKKCNNISLDWKGKQEWGYGDTVVHVRILCPTSTLAHPTSCQSLIITKFGWTSVTLRNNLKNGTLSILHIFLMEKRAIEQN